MKLKMKLYDFANMLLSGELVNSRPQAAQLLGWMLNFVLGFILSSIELAGKCAPFGLAAVAQAGTQVAGLMCAFGASIGYLAFFGFEEGIKYVAALVLIFTAGYVFQELKIYRKIIFMPVVAAFFTLVTGLLGYFTSVNGESIIIPIITQTLIAGGSTYFFAEAFSTRERDTESSELRHGISLIVLISCLLMALSKVQLGGLLSIGRIISVIIVMTAAYKGGMLSGAAAGAVMGLAMDISSPRSAFYAMTYAFSGLISGVFKRHGRLTFLISYILTGAMLVLQNINMDSRVDLLYEVFASSVIFMVLPTQFVNSVGAMLKPVQVSGGESGLRKYTAKRISRMGEAFKELYDTVDSALSKDNNDGDISKIFDRASEVVCAHCKGKTDCWNKNYMNTLSVFNDVTDVITKRGSINKSDLPGHFAESCTHLDELVGAINGELRAQVYRKRFQLRLEENRQAAYSQYFDISQILSGVADELKNSYGPDILAQRRLNRYLAGMDLEADTSVFRDKGGRMHIIIESAKLRRLIQEPGYLDRLSAAVGLRLCRSQQGEREQEGRIVLMEAEPYAVSVGIASMKKKGEDISGDRGTYFKTDQGVLFILLSDGMGSGEDAARESSCAIRILEQFLRSGVDPGVAMKMLNSLMLIKNGDEWGFATVDLMCVDLFTGETVFYKFGAAPSYIRNGKTIKRIKCDSLAAGLYAGEDSAPDVVRMRLKPGSMALIASDGVIADSNDTWVRTLLSEYDQQDTKALARQVLHEALKQYGCGDDMTVLAVRLENRE